MTARASLWHMPLALGALVVGCYEVHSRTSPLPRVTPVERDSGLRDAPELRVPDAATRDAPIDGGGASDLCAEVFALLRSGVSAEAIPCDGRTFPRACFESLSECCRLYAGCAIDAGDGGHVETNFTCDDSCDQACARYPEADCSLVPECEWFNSQGCDPVPPSCIRQRGAACVTDAECTGGERCLSLSIPCREGLCDACMEERRCSY